MVKPTSGSRAGAPLAARRRMPAADRRRSILEAARRAFSQTGDMNGTTIRTIAAYSGISEGAIYRHFDSKEQLFYEAVVEPLREAVDELVEAMQVLPQRVPLTDSQRVHRLEALYDQLTNVLLDVLPLLGLVLFGDPATAKRFYIGSLSSAMDRLAAAWQATAATQGVRLESPEVAARAVMGVALLLALEAHHGGDAFDRAGAVARVSQGTMGGFFAVQPARPRRR